MLKRFLILILFSVLIFGGIFGLKFYQLHQEAGRFQPPPPAVVAATEVTQEIWPSTLSAVGSLTAIAGVDVSNEVAGKVEAIHFDSGQSVKKGQLLLELDASTDRAELQGLQAEMRLAKVRFERSEKLIGKNFISKSDYDQNHALLDETVAAVHAKRTLIDRKRIRAPFTGELGIRLVNLGQYLTEGSAIVSLQQLDPIYLDFTVPERFLNRLVKGRQVIATVQAYPGREFNGEISAVSPLIDQGTRSVQVRAMLNNSEKLLHPGMFAQIGILSDQELKVLTLPDTAITYNPYGNSVFVIEANEQGLIVQSRQVETGQTRAGRIEIINGLSLGERVVSAGQVKLRNGMPVTLDDKPAPGEREISQ
ncbi:MAG TPA: efflux transporter periplasmic adaptor subunit [Methylococcaceae bacterium]|nr:efflux transporter periplasmic adaptor subunit [Methylococcaceae bacterium]